MKSAASSYRREIDGLRALAVLPVLFFHAGFSWASGGFVGVDVFFVISGYLITGILLNDLNTDSFSLKNFYVRRARRILPALFLVTLVCIPFAIISMTPVELVDFAKSAVATATFLSNFFFNTQSGYFSHLTDEMPLLHTWSLAVEEQFYIVFPLILLASWHFARQRIFWILVTIGIGSLLLSQIGGNINFSRPIVDPDFRWSNQSSLASFYLPFGRAWELMVGALISYCSLDKAGRSCRASSVFAWIGILMVLLSIFLYGRDTLFPSIATLLPVGGTALIIIFAHSDSSVARILSRREFVGIGLISYSLYLWHQPVLAFARLNQIDPLGSLQAILLLTACVPVSYLSWKFVELPFRNHNFWKNSRRVFTASVFSILTAVSIAVLLISLKGIPTRFTEEFNRIDALATHTEIRQDCQTSGTNFRKFVENPEMFCSLNEGIANVAIIGDSHVPEFAIALAARLERAQVAVVSLGFDDCPPAMNYDAKRPGCTRWTKQTIEYFLNSYEDVTNVFVLYRHAYYYHGDSFPDFPVLPDDPPPIKSGDTIQEKRGIYWDGFLALIERLRDSGKTVHVILPVPELGTSIKRLLRLSDDLTRVPGASRNYYDRRQFEVRNALLNLGDEIRIIDPALHFCDEINCYATIDSIPLYFDDDHMSIVGAKFLIDQLQPAFLDSLKAR